MGDNFVAMDAPYTHTLAGEVVRREDARLLAYMADVARVPFPLRVFIRPDVFMLEVRVPGARLAAIDQRTLHAAPTTAVDVIAHRLGQLAGQAWRKLEPLPVPDNVVLGDS